jgi:hypothetical protein
MRGEVDHLELGAACVIIDASGHREARPGDDRDTVGSRGGFKPRILLERRCIQPHQFRGSAIGHQNLPGIGDHSSGFRKALQARDMAPRLGIDHLEAVASGMRNEDAARRGLKGAMVKRAVDRAG